MPRNAGALSPVKARAAPWKNPATPRIGARREAVGGASTRRPPRLADDQTPAPAGDERRRSSAATRRCTALTPRPLENSDDRHATTAIPRWLSGRVTERQAIGRDAPRHPRDHRRVGRDPLHVESIREPRRVDSAAAARRGESRGERRESGRAPRVGRAPISRRRTPPPREPRTRRHPAHPPWR